MNYIRQLNAFFDYLQRNSLSQSEQLLYHTLLMVNNSCGWIENFGRTNQSLAGIMGVSINTLLKARNQLQQKGLISFKKGKKSEVTRYSIRQLYQEYSSKYEPQNEPYNEPYSEPQTEPYSEPYSEHILNNKLKHKHKNNNNNIPRQFPENSPEMLLAQELKAYILQNNSTARAPKDLTGWASEFDKMIRIDNRKPEQIRSVMKYSQQDKFWRSNILSAKKLREKYDTLYLQSCAKEERVGYQKQKTATEKLKELELM